jgi:NAD-dependent DNA ligase
MKTDEVQLLRQAGEAGLLKMQRYKRFSLTGKLSMLRRDMISLIQAVGASYDEHPRWGTDYLIVGDTSVHGRTQKMREAESRGTKIISESDFVRMISPS